MIAGLGAWEVYSGAGRELLGLGAASKAVDVARLAAPNRLAGRPSVGVLPFKNLSGDAGQDYFSDGITEDVIGALGRSRTCWLRPNQRAFNSRVGTLHLPRSGACSMRAISSGAVYAEAGDRVRVNVELTDAETGRHLWSETYDAELKDIFAVQDDIARRVVGAAAAKLTRFEQERVLAKPTSSLAAYEYVLRGRDRTVTATREQNDASREMFQRAIDLDPTYAAAYAALGGTYFDAVVSGWTEFRDEEVERAAALAQKALALDPATTSAYRLLAAAHLYRGHHDLALGQIDRALEINPSDAESYAYRGYILVYAGKSGEAVPWLEAALRFDRANTRATMYIGTAYYQALWA